MSLLRKQLIKLNRLIDEVESWADKTAKELF